MTKTASVHGISRASMVIAGFSTIVEWYDFTLYLYFATVLSRVFFGGGQASLATTLAGFAFAYCCVHWARSCSGTSGDRFGRRRMMLLSMAVMAAAMLAIALLPTYAAIGPAAGWLLLLLRCVISFSVGGEYTGVVAYLLEGARADRRGLITSSASAASEIGALFAVGICALTVHALSPADLDSWGWRIPFLSGAALASLVWIARSAMQESPDFERQQAAGTAPMQPLRYTLANHRAGIWRAFAISALGSITYYVGITYVPAFLTSAGALQENAALLAVHARRIGRDPGDAFGGRAVGPGGPQARAGGFESLQRGSADGDVLFDGRRLAAAGFVGCDHPGWSCGCGERGGRRRNRRAIPGEGRLSGLALGATTATAVFGGLTPWLAQVLVETHRLADDARRDDRGCGAMRPAGIAELAAKCEALEGEPS